MKLLSPEQKESTLGIFSTTVAESLRRNFWKDCRFPEAVVSPQLETLVFATQPMGSITHVIPVIRYGVRVFNDPSVVWEQMAWLPPSFPRFDEWQRVYHKRELWDYYGRGNISFIEVHCISNVTTAQQALNLELLHPNIATEDGSDLLAKGIEEAVQQTATEHPLLWNTLAQPLDNSGSLKMRL